MVCDMTAKQSDSPVARAERTRSGRTYLPGCDIIERENELTLVADIPGVRSESLEISFERGLLSIHARIDPSREEGRRYLHREYGVGDFHREFQIGDGIDADRIEAELSSGVLTLHLPKAAKILPRKIAVKAE